MHDARRAADAATSDEEPQDTAPLVAAEGLSLAGPRGWVYRGVGLSLDRGGLVAVSGEAGSGRTSLLLTLAGRMRPTSGTLTVAGRTAPRLIRRVAAIGAIRGVNDLEDALTVAEHVFEAKHLRSGLLPRRRRRRADEVADALAPVGLDLDPDVRVGDLRPGERLLLGAALALTARPELLVIDDADGGMRMDDQRAMWTRMRRLTADAGVAIVASCVDAIPAEDLADVEVSL